MDQQIKAFPKQIELDGNLESVMVLVVDGEEGLPLKRAAELYGIDQSTVHYHLITHKIACTRLSRKQIMDLKSQGLMNRHIPNLRFLNQTALAALSQVVKSGRPKEVYAAIWSLRDLQHRSAPSSVSADVYFEAGSKIRQVAN